MYLLIPILRKLQLPILLNYKNSRVLTNSSLYYFWKSGPSYSPVHTLCAQAVQSSATNHLLQFLDSLQLLLPTPVLLTPKQRQRSFF